VQIVEWYDELLRITDSPVVRLNRAVAVGEADGARRPGCAALAEVATCNVPPRASAYRRRVSTWVRSMSPRSILETCRCPFPMRSATSFCVSAANSRNSRSW
jgi:hypothetical protein